MRICVFSPDLAALADSGWRSRLDAAVGPNHEVFALTNSWADPPPGSDVRTTGGVTDRRMRATRRILGRDATANHRTWRGRIAARFVDGVAEELLEGVRATDPDLVVSLHAGWTEQLCRLFRRPSTGWPCITLGDPPPTTGTGRRRYDPAALVSIVLPTYNGTRFLAESIRSCLVQSHHALELIVVDDGSRSAVQSIVDSFADDPRLVYVRHDTNRGLPTALNTGFRRATGAYCSWTSDDNYYAPHAIERMLTFMATYPGLDFVYADSYRCDEVADGGGTARSVIRARPPGSLAVDNFIGACFLYTREVCEQIGDFNPDAVLAEDYDYWVRVHRQFTMQRLFETLYTYRFHAASLTSTHAPGEVARTVLRIKRAYGLGPHQ